QEAFIAGDVQIIVATSAFGMGVDKKDVKLVVHFDISASLENYVQEAGRAGRDQSLQAECHVLYNDNDLDSHFVLLNQTKLSISEIQQVWKAIKDLTKARSTICRSPLEIARQAGWDESVREIETRVKTAVSALETAGYIKRGMNVPRVFATSILVKTMDEASAIINSSQRFDEKQKQNASRIMKLLISSRSISKAGNDEAESRVDYISDLLGIPKADVIYLINVMREESLLADSKDLSAYIRRTDNQNKSLSIMQKYARLEEFLISLISDEGNTVNLKEINDMAESVNIKGSSVKSIKTILYYWTIKSYIQKTLNTSEKSVQIIPEISLDSFESKYNKRINLAEFIVKYLFDKSLETNETQKEEVLVQFSVLELKNAYNSELNILKNTTNISFEDVEEALLYLSKIDALNLEGGFLVLYNAMEIKRLELDNKIQYKKADYSKLDEFYKQKIQQIHIVGEYANMMVRDYDEALQFVNGYFQMDFKKFIAKYFKGNRSGEINRNITPAKYKQLFDSLSDVQSEIINDSESKYIVVTAGPGSGKTRVLVHKLASLLLLEDVKHEQLLMLTFSRAAATEFKKRLIELIGKAANYVEIKTFHSYCFDLLGRIGNLEKVNEVVKNAAEMIQSGEVEVGRITKNVVVIDEAQDMNETEFALIEAIIARNDDMRVIAVGDDDQNIYEFRGSSSKYLKSFITDNGAENYELLQNYRSKQNIVEFANAFSETISQRLKSQPVQPVKQESGVVRLIKHSSINLEIPVVNNIKTTYKSGSVCVLTNTNDEALRVVGLLKKEGIKANLIQANDGFNLSDLVEFRYFMKIINQEVKSPVISDEIWNDAKNRLKQAYRKSKCLDICLNLLEDFEQVNSWKYKTDLELFIRESKLEELYKNGQEEIIVSTIHKSKGREFDSVYMMMNNVDYHNDECKRKIYVGLTRAKNELYIHCNNSCFDKFNVPEVEKIFDSVIYPEPDEIMTQLTHRDVFLGFFKNKKSLIVRLISGTELHISGNSLFIKTSKATEKVIILSKAYQDKMAEMKRKGYVPYKAKIRFVVAWKDKEDEQECAILLPDIFYRKEY
ncbi:MAG TPA: AAA family ATPase, partial [Clostridiales bacterium]|nr:AAA family ATPase [Clostridiales bacterium]